MQQILVTSYVNPDIDGVASAFAYCEFLKKTGKYAVIGVIGEVHDEVKYIFNRFDFVFPKIIVDTDDFNDVILVDASTLNILENKIIIDKVTEIIDHRKIHEASKFVNAKIQIELVGAAATLIAEKFIQNDIDISKESAILLYSAIISNTLNLNSSVTTQRDKNAALWLKQIAGLSEVFWEDMFIAKSDLAGKKLADRINGDFAWFIVGKKKIGIAQIEMIGAEKLVNDRTEEIIQVLEKIKAELKLDFIFQNIIDLKDLKSFFVTNDIETKKLLEKVFGVKFIGMLAEKSPVIMRKQIVPLLK